MLRQSQVTKALSCALLLACGPSVTAVDDSASSTSESEEAAFQIVADRYLTILLDHPRRGVAFDRWYRLHLDAGRLDELVSSLDRDENADGFATQILLGFVSERRGNLSGAWSAYEAAERIDSTQFVAPYSLGLLHLREGRHAAAAECLSRGDGAGGIDRGKAGRASAGSARLSEA